MTMVFETRRFHLEYYLLYLSFGFTDLTVNDWYPCGTDVLSITQ